VKSLIVCFSLLCWVGCLKGQTAPPSADAPATVPLDTVLASGTLWDTPSGAFVQEHREVGFRWLSTARDSAQSTLKGVTFLGLPVYQTNVEFAQEKPKQATVFFYNRGDAGSLSQADYKALLKQAMDALTTATKTNYTVRGKDNANAVKAEGLIWTAEQTVYLLEYSFTKTASVPFRSEFIRLQITQKEKPKGLLEAAQDVSKKPAQFRGVDHLATDTVTGDVTIKDLPMVDQGEKGYCVVASAERVLRYYGVRVDENELAQLANTSSEGGTSFDAMTGTLKKLTARLKIRVRTVDETNVHGLLAMIADYNRLASVKKTKPVPPAGHMIDVAALYGEMDPAVFREMRAKNHAAMTSFEHKVKMHVDKGVPLLWTVMLGIVPEPHVKAPQPAGHMRVIIGYNEKKKEIVYSDSWGMGNESKRMALADAWAINTGLTTIEPF